MALTNKYLALCKSDLTKYCEEELSEFNCVNPLETGENIVLFSLTDNKDLLQVFEHLGCAYSLIKVLWSGDDLEQLQFNNEFVEILNPFVDKLKLVFPSGFKFRVLCEGISGNEKRISSARLVQRRLIDFFNDKYSGSIKLEIDYKNPNLIFTLTEDKNKFYLGVRLHSLELDSRDFRVYTHKASFKGDFAASICREAGIKNANKIMFIFSRDGVLAIETALMLNQLPLREKRQEDIFIDSTGNVNKVGDYHNDTKDHERKNLEIVCIDDSSSNVRAASNNAKLAGVFDDLKFFSYSIDEIDMHLQEDYFDVILAHMTSKDERRINEILFQANSILRVGAKLVLIARPNFEIEGDSRFELVANKYIQRGSGQIKLIILQKQKN